jgi:hypothetical protein
VIATAGFSSINALDECTQCSENVVALITVLTHVYRDPLPPTRIRFCLTSRPEDHNRGNFRILSYPNSVICGLVNTLRINDVDLQNVE